MTALAKGSIITATVEEALDNCIIVRVIHGPRTFRGVLLDERNSLISRIPKGEEHEKNIQGTSDFTAPHERSGVVMLQGSPRRTANSRRSGLSQRLILLRQQEEGRSEATIVDSLPTYGVPGFVHDGTHHRRAQRKRGRQRKSEKQLKTAKGSSSKAKGGVKRKKKLPEDSARPYKKTKQTLYSQSEIEQHNIVVQPCLVRVCPLMKGPGILNQNTTALDTEVQTSAAYKSRLNSVTEESIAQQFISDHGQNMQTQTVSKLSGIKRLSVDLKQLPSSSFVKEESDTVNVLSERNIAKQFDCEGQNVQTQQVTKTPEVTRFSFDLEQLPMGSGAEESDSVSLLSEATDTVSVNISDEETDSATSFIDKDTTADDMTTVITDCDDQFETVEILSVETASVLANDVESAKDVCREIPVGNGPETSTNNTSTTVNDTTSPQGDKLSSCQSTPQSSDRVFPTLYNDVRDVGEDTSTVVNDTTSPQGDEISSCQNTPQSSDEVFPVLHNDVTTDPKSLLMKVVPQPSSDSEQFSNCLESSIAMLTIVVKLRPASMKTREETSAPKPTVQTDHVYARKSPRFSVKDIVWGKLPDHPWWPGKVSSLSGTVDEVGSLSAKDATIAWFGINTSSVLPVSCLSPFVADFHLRHSPDKKGHYRIAVQAAKAQACKQALKH